jgi:ribosome-associated heat shock protein Hsp15
MNGLRLDSFLWFARLAKSRMLAQRFVAEGQVRIDGMRATNKHVQVRTGQVLTLTIRGQFRVIRIEMLPLRRGPASEAAECFSEIVGAQPIDGAIVRL